MLGDEEPAEVGATSEPRTWVAVLVYWSVLRSGCDRGPASSIPRGVVANEEYAAQSGQEPRRLIASRS